MNLPPSAAAPAPPSSSAPRSNWPRLLLNAAVTLVVLAVAAATFVLSYAGVHAIALQGGVSVQLARIYPGLFDAVLVLACVAAVVLRDGRWWARSWAWLVVIVILGAIGVTDVLHATNYALRHRVTEGVVAAAPVVAVLLAFSLLLTVLRQSRPSAPDAAQAPRRRAGRHAARQSTAPAVATPIDATPIDATPIDAVPVVAAGAVPRPPAPPIALPPAPLAEAADEPYAESALAPDASAPPAETVEIPAYPGDPDEAADAGEAAGQDLPFPAAPPGEEAALTPDAPAATEAEDAPDAVEALDVPATPDAEATPDAPELAPEAPDDPGAPDAPNPPTEPRRRRWRRRRSRRSRGRTGSRAVAPADADSDAVHQVRQQRGGRGLGVRSRPGPGRAGLPGAHVGPRHRYVPLPRRTAGRRRRRGPALRHRPVRVGPASQPGARHPDPAERQG
jgi:Protein of unknown function (DUF2637)